ncbi:hypothetical protein CBOM_03402 [Ceraceosorus bombacis]|uniref:YMC020W-like alpha/beta hydrolase domain-containing protein n=1 Tax=Ceraceosorus bombacis TaxID=401625 RepID=A0A0N7LAR9_9BASI|nr:hypothetical protein CBOM_03402 [Ceraceosorus bombacis]
MPERAPSIAPSTISRSGVKLSSSPTAAQATLSPASQVPSTSYLSRSAESATRRLQRVASDASFSVRTPHRKRKASARAAARRRTWWGFGPLEAEAEPPDAPDVQSLCPPSTVEGSPYEEKALQAPEVRNGSTSRRAARGGRINGVARGTVAQASPLRQGWGADSEASLQGLQDLTTKTADLEGTTENALVPEPDREVAGTVPLQNPAASAGSGWGWPIWNRSAPEANDTAQLSLEALRLQGETPAAQGAAEHSSAGDGITAAPASYYDTTVGLISRWMPGWPRIAEPSDAANVTALDTAEVKQPPPALTPAEQVKAEALARPAHAPIQTPELEARKAVLNSATKSGWISYFSSRSAHTASHRVGDAPDGPEVMEIDFEGSTEDGTPANAAGLRPASRNFGRPRGASGPAPPGNGDGDGGAGRKKKDKLDNATPTNGAPTSSRLQSGPPGLAHKLSRGSLKGSEPSRSSIAGKGPTAGGKAGETPVEVARREAAESENRLPRTWAVMGLKERAKSRGCREADKVVVIGIHGWFSVGPLAKWFGEPTGTSTKLATMMADSVKRHYEGAGLEPPSTEHGHLTVIPLQGDGKVADRIDKLYAALLAQQQWVQAVKDADVLFIAAHSQGCVVATHLLARLLEQGTVQPSRTRTALLAIAGINHGPFNSLRSGVSNYYLNAFETPAAKELFEYQSSSSTCSRQYSSAQRIVLDKGVKVAYVASVDDQVVPLYSALNSSTSHPSIVRALYVDSRAFPRVDFLTNLLAFCVGVRNAGLPDHGLLSLLSASVAGSLYAGEGHSKCYEEPLTYDFAARYLLETTSPLRPPTLLVGESAPPAPIFETFEPQRWNPYSLPRSLRGKEVLVAASVVTDGRPLSHSDERKLTAW